MAKPTTYAQPLAHVWLKTNQLGSTVLLKNVTPAQLMWLVADHHVNAGGDPVMRLTECDEQAEKDAAVAQRAEIAAAQAKIDDLQNVELTDEIRERRTASLEQRRKVAQSKLDDLEALGRLRALNPAQERMRLASKYGLRKVTKFYPGQFPSLPQTFEEARSAGVQSSTGGERLLTAGAAQDQDYATN